MIFFTRICVCVCVRICLYACVYIFILYSIPYLCARLLRVRQADPWGVARREDARRKKKQRLGIARQRLLLFFFSVIDFIAFTSTTRHMISAIPSTKRFHSP